MKTLLDVQDLQVHFDTQGGSVQAVRGVSFSLVAGEILGVVGESGSGKSVSAHSLLKLLPANGNIDEGRVLYQGEDVMQYSPDKLRQFRGAQTAIIFQEPGVSFDPIYPIGKALAETLRAHNPELSDQDVEARSIELLEEVNIPQPRERLGNFPHQFSGGLLQRIMIALALASDPKILIADEPTTALDVTIQAQIIALLLRLRRERNLAIVFITHNLALVSGIADRIMVMYGGLVMEQGTADQVLKKPRHPYTRALLNSILSLGAHHESQPLHVVPGNVPNPLRPEPGCPFAPRCSRAIDECRQAVPVIKKVDGGEHRCLFPFEAGGDQ